MQLAEHELVRERALEPQSGGQRLAALLVSAHLPAHADRPVEDRLLGRRAGLDAGQDLRVDLLEHTRHAADEVRAHFFEVVADLVEVLGEGRAEPAIDAEERLEPGEGVRERQEEQVHPPLLARRCRLGVLLGGDVVTVGLHDALRRPRGAGGVDDRGQVVGLRAGQARGQRAGVLRGVVATEAAQHRPRHDHLGRLRGLVARDHDDVLEPRRLVTRLEHLGELPRVLHDDRPRAGVVDDVGDEVRRVGRIHRNRDAARAEDREVGLHPFGPARREQRDGVAGLAAERDQPERYLAHDLAHLAPRQRRPRAVTLEHLRGAIGALLHPAPEHRSQGFAHALSLHLRRVARQYHRGHDATRKIA